MVEIRLAAEGDVPRMVELLGYLFEQEAEFAPSAEAQARGLAAILAAPEAGRLLVAEAAGQVIGMVNLLYTVSTALGGRVAILEDVVVDPEARGRGVGKALMDAAIAQCRADGALRVTLLTDHDNHKAHAFYEAQGFRRSPMVPFRRMIEGD